MRYLLPILFSSLFCGWGCQSKQPVYRKAELEKRIVQYYTLQQKPYTDQEIFFNALRSHIVPTNEGDEFARYVVNSLQNFWMNNKDITIVTEIVNISSKEDNRVAKVTTREYYIYPNFFSDEIYHTTEWVYVNDEWYRSSKKGCTNKVFL